MNENHATFGFSSWRASAAFIFSVAVLFGGRAFAATADDPDSKFVLAALAKLNETPHHAFSTPGTAGDAESESISVGDKNYIKLRGHWRISPMTPAKMAEQSRENLRDAKVYHCEHERDETLDGEAVAVYKIHGENDLGVTDGEIWISKSRELPLRQIVVLPDGRHVTMRFDYANVTAPSLG